MNAAEEMQRTIDENSTTISMALEAAVKGEDLSDIAIGLLCFTDNLSKENAEDLAIPIYLSMAQTLSTLAVAEKIQKVFWNGRTGATIGDTLSDLASTLPGRSR